MDKSSEIVIPAWLIDAMSGDSFAITVFADDPWFIVMGVVPGSAADSALRRGSLLQVDPLQAQDARTIIGVSVVRNVLGSHYELLAPERVESTDGPHKYVRLRASGPPIALRPGSTIVGGRRSGFYDSEGIILSAQFVGGSRTRFEDWAYLVASDKGQFANWVPLDDINIPVAGPERVFAFPSDDGKDRQTEIVDFLIRSGERELIDYLSSHETLLKNLDGRQFEHTAQSIYRALGFDVEPMGNWNQADGGVDFIAVSKRIDDVEIRTAVQCKASRNKISARPMREIAGVLPRFNAQQGIVVTTSTFTEPARAERDDWFAHIELADRLDLYDKIQQIMGGWGVDTTNDDGPLIGLTFVSLLAIDPANRAVGWVIDPASASSPGKRSAPGMQMSVPDAICDLTRATGRSCPPGRSGPSRDGAGSRVANACGCSRDHFAGESLRDLRNSRSLAFGSG
jgi:hypothetical protein